MIGLKIAGVSLVLFITGLIINQSLRREDPSYQTPDAVAWLAAVGVLGVPLGLIIAIIGV